MNIKEGNLDSSLIDKLGLDKNIAKILFHRGFSTEESINTLLNYNKITDSKKLSNINKITTRIKQAIDNKEKIVICGDYDVDGAISTAILYRYFKQINYPVDYYIPHRMEDGYGISAPGVEKLYSQGYTLLISVDNGIAAFDAADKAKELGIDLIITDHHDVVGNKLPDTYAILNPKLDNLEKCKYLSGAGVAFFLINQINKDLNFNVDLRPFLVMAMIASVTDVVPLLDDNRVIVKLGLDFVKKFSNKGLMALFEETKLNLTHLTAKDIGYKIGPILNAAGRLGGAEKTFKLLVEDEDLKVQILVEQLKQINLERRTISNEAVSKYIDSVDNSHRIIVVDGNIHQGVLGIVASKIKDKYSKPVVIIGIDDNQEKGKASCRSVPEFNIKDAIEHCQEFHLGGGGHSMAAGFSINRSQVNQFKNKLYSYADNLEFKKFEEELELNLTIKDVNKKFLTEMKNLEPFGAKFEYPKVKYTGTITDLRIFKNEHISLKLDKKVSFLIFFADLSKDLNKYRLGTTIEVFGELSVSQNEAKIISFK